MSWFFLALLIPIIIHFFFFRKIKVALFTGVKFLKEITIEKRNSRKVKQWILLVCRLAFFAAIIIAFLDYGMSESDAGSSRLYLIDNSVSTTLQGKDEHIVLNRLLDFVQQNVNQYTDSEAQQISSFGQTSLQSINSFNKEQILSNVSAIRTVDSYKEVVSRHVPRDWDEVFVLSDFQGSDVVDQLSTLNFEVSLTLVHGQMAKRSNVFVDTVYLEGLFLTPNIDNKLVVQLAIDNHENLDEVTVRLLNDGFLLSTATALIEDTTEDLEFILDKTALKSGNIIIEILEPGVEYDNRYYLTIPEYQKVKVTHIFENQSNKFIGSVYSNDALFEYSSFSVSGPSYESLEKADLLILDQLSSIPAFLTSFNGAVIVIPPAEDFDPLAYSTFIGTKVAMRTESISSTFDLRSLTHEIFDGSFEEIDQSTRLPVANNLYILGQGNTGEKIIFDQFNRPLLSQVSKMSSIQQSIYFFSFPLEPEYTDLMTHSIFIPMMYGLAFRSKVMQPIYAYRMDEQYVSIPRLASDIEPPLLMARDSISYVSNYLEGTERLVIELPPEVSQPGFYHMISASDTVMTFALNHSISESRMVFATQQELETLAEKSPNIKYISLDSSQSFTNVQAQSVPQLWNYFLIIAFFFLSSELMVARFL